MNPRNVLQLKQINVPIPVNRSFSNTVKRLFLIFEYSKGYQSAHTENKMSKEKPAR